MNALTGCECPWRLSEYNPPFPRTLIAHLQGEITKDGADSLAPPPTPIGASTQPNIASVNSSVIVTAPVVATAPATVAASPPKQGSLRGGGEPADTLGRLSESFVERARRSTEELQQKIHEFTEQAIRSIRAETAGVRASVAERSKGAISASSVTGAETGSIISPANSSVPSASPATPAAIAPATPAAATPPAAAAPAMPAAAAPLATPAAAATAPLAKPAAAAAAPPATPAAPKAALFLELQSISDADVDVAADTSADVDLSADADADVDSDADAILEDSADEDALDSKAPTAAATAVTGAAGEAAKGAAGAVVKGAAGNAAKGIAGAIAKGAVGAVAGVVGGKVGGVLAVANTAASAVGKVADAAGKITGAISANKVLKGMRKLGGKIGGKRSGGKLGSKRLSKLPSTTRIRSGRSNKNDEQLTIMPAPDQPDQAIRIRAPGGFEKQRSGIVGHHAYTENLGALLGEVDKTEAKIKLLRTQQVEVRTHIKPSFFKIGLSMKHASLLLQKENFLESLDKRRTLIQTDVSADKESLTSLQAHKLAIDTRIARLKQERIAQELAAQENQYDAADKKLSTEADNIKAVSKALKARIKAIDDQTKPLLATEQAEMRKSLKLDGAGGTKSGASPAGDAAAPAAPTGDAAAPAADADAPAA